MRRCLALALLAGFFLLKPLSAEACHGDAPIVSLVDGASLEATAQTGLRLRGRYGLPRAIEVRQVGGSATVVLNMTPTKVNNRPGSPDLRRRLLSQVPEPTALALLEDDVPNPNEVLLKPKHVLDSDLEYELTFLDGDKHCKLRVKFKGGFQRC